MNFDFTEEQNMLRDSLSRFLREKYDFEARTKILASDAGWSRDVWEQFAEMGLLMVPFAEEYDGLGGDLTDIMVVMEEIGKSIVVEPYLPTVVLAGGLLQATGGDLAKEWLPQIGAGAAIMGFGYTEPHSRFDLFHVDASAKKDGDAYVLNGRKSVVLAAPIADRLIVSVRTGGGSRDRDGISLVMIDPSADGVTIESYPTIDGLQAGDVVLENVRVPADQLLGAEGAALPVIEKVIDQGIAAIAAEATGACKVMCELTQSYCRERKQFGVPISKFQVLQHKMVDMFIHTQEITSMTFAAVIKQLEDAEDAEAMTAAAKVQLGKSVKFVGENAIQLHGGMGITEEMAIGHYFMHTTMLELMFGNTDYHHKRYEALTGLRKAA
jgi:hypothetical protein